MAEPVAISDHALVRWLERTGVLEVQQLRQIVSGTLRRATDAAQAIGSTNYVVLADGLVYIVRDGVLVTVVEDDGRNARVRALAYKQAAD